jgi:succinyl-CoA synthetase beta subunit
MNIHEYQAKELFSSYGIPILKGGVARTPSEARQVAEKLGGSVWVVKAQVHAGGRGKGGGIKVAKSLEEVESFSQKMLGSLLVTPQTGPQGKKVHQIYIEEGCAIAQEFYLSFLVDREKGCLTLVVSKEGGVNIEEVAHHTPEKIMTIPIHPATGMQPHHARKAAYGLGLTGKEAAQGIKTILGMSKAFTDLDASLMEINPLVLTSQGEVLPLDAKISFDDNALYRHPHIQALYDEREEDPAEVEAKKHDLNYVKLEGNIGCMVNGAGLAMATMDIIKLYGGDPANFLDVGGGATKERVATAFKLILSDPNVKGILVNIFGGIMRCDLIAEGIVAAAKEMHIHVPLVVRLQGTNGEKGRSILSDSGLSITSVEDFSTAAETIVKLVKEGR